MMLISRSQEKLDDVARTLSKCGADLPAAREEKRLYLLTLLLNGLVLMSPTATFPPSLLKSPVGGDG